MTAVADIFDRDGDGYIDYYEFVAALHPNKDAYRPTTDADKIEDEVHMGSLEQSILTVALYCLSVDVWIILGSNRLELMFQVSLWMLFQQVLGGLWLLRSSLL